MSFSFSCTICHITATYSIAAEILIILVERCDLSRCYYLLQGALKFCLSLSCAACLTAAAYFKAPHI